MEKNIRSCFMTLCILFSLASFCALFKIGVIPYRYSFMFGGSILLLLVIVLVFLFLKKKHFKIIGYVLGTILLIGNGVLFHYLQETDYFLNKAFSGKIIETTRYYLVTSKDEHPDLSGKVLYYSQLYQKDKIMDLSNNVLIVLLDEMNLAHIELYFADLLSKLEERRGENKDITFGGKSIFSWEITSVSIVSSRES